MTSHAPRIAVVGSGPSGSILSALLADKGIDVALFNGGKRPDMIVGESGIPAVVPVMRRLGIEEEVAALAQHKPGATFAFGSDSPIQLSFRSVEGILPAYSYNLPRPQFDQILENRARRSKMRWIEQEAAIVLAPAGAGREVMLDDATLSLVPDWKGEQPDLIVDATGRRRTVARLLKIPVKTGPRKDAALFAHFTGWKHPGPPGQIVISRTSFGGWSWQIPLKDRMSVGVVIPRETLQSFGSTPEERLEAAIERDPILSAAGADRQRISGVPVYSNYQLISERAFGPGWAAVGDAFGFVDPMLSPGLWIALRSGECLADLIRPEGGNRWPQLLATYESEMRERLIAWQDLIEKFYNGEMMAAYATGGHFAGKFPGPFFQILNRHVGRHFAAMCCGAYTERSYSRRLLNFMCKNPRGFDPKAYAID
jgi:flavin-dependent dehydrogenase